MKLFHAFPRPAYHLDASGKAVRSSTDEDRCKGLEILRLILTRGLLCTPEKFHLYPNQNTENAEKQVYRDAEQPHDTIVQSRACFTSMDAVELSKENELSHRHETDHPAHVDLFGKFAIGLDPLEAREIGIMPTVYYYRHNMELFARAAGLGSQIIERLDEIRCLFSVLSFIEAKARSKPEDRETFLTAEKLRSLGIGIRCQKDIEAEIANLSARDAEYIFNLLNTDRVPAWNLVDFIEIMLSLYQTTDSTIEKNAPLAFFQQREWRLVHHMMKGLLWFSMGNHPADRDPGSEYFRESREDIEYFLRRQLSGRSEDYITWFLNHSWVLAGTEKPLHFRDFVREIIVPEDCYSEALNIVNSLSFRSKPTITILPRKWRIVTDNGTPKIVMADIN